MAFARHEDQLHFVSLSALEVFDLDGVRVAIICWVVGQLQLEVDGEILSLCA